MERLRASIQQAKLAQEEYVKRNTPEIRAPLKLSPSLSKHQNLLQFKSNLPCSMETCFDYSKCPLTRGFGVYIYDLDKHQDFTHGLDPMIVQDPEQACIFLVILNESNRNLDFQEINNQWNSNGRNLVVLDMTEDNSSVLMAKEHVPSALFVSSISDLSTFRSRFDLTMSYVSNAKLPENAIWTSTAHILPIRKHFLITFQGQVSKASEIQKEILEVLQKINDDKTDDKVEIHSECSKLEQFDLCDNSEKRKSLLKRGTFALILNPGQNLASSKSFQIRILESLQAGAIPVVLGSADISSALPFSEVIDWSKAVISVPMARITELHFLLRSFTDGDLFSMQRQGNLIFKSFLATPTLVLKTTLNVIRERLNIPPTVAVDVPSPSIFNESLEPPLKMDQLPPEMEPNEALGPLEQPKASTGFRRNFSTTFLDSYRRWNVQFDPFSLPPYSPWEPILPTDAKFLGSYLGFRPIADGVGGSGKEFSQAIGGNSPSEQFTVVILTYEREEVLMDSIARLYGLPFLNKVVVVWNTEAPPSPDLRWPEIGVPLEVIRTEKNSLNNRFLPYDTIETEAILSVDDDAHLRHDEIIFGFR